MNTIDNFSLEVFGKVPLLSFVLRRLIDFLDNVQRFHLRTLQVAKFMQSFLKLGHLDSRICCGIVMIP